MGSEQDMLLTHWEPMNHVLQVLHGLPNSVQVEMKVWL